MLNQELKFPVVWHYKIITEKTFSGVKNEIQKVLDRNGIADLLEDGNESSAGKYLSYKFSVTFNDRETMRRISSELAAVKGVKFLI
ncbi:MAG: HP0495 family protein [Victivallaceae bacterium]